MNVQDWTPLQNIVIMVALFWTAAAIPILLIDVQDRRHADDATPLGIVWVVLRTIYMTVCSISLIALWFMPLPEQLTLILNFMGLGSIFFISIPTRKGWQMWLGPQSRMTC